MTSQDPKLLDQGPGEAVSSERGRDTGEIFDVVVVGGGPSGATAADDLARMGHSVLLLDRAGRIKPCGGAIPPRAVKDFDIPDRLLKAKINTARVIAPSDSSVDMPIDGGYVGMVDRDEFDEWLRQRAEDRGATRRTGVFERLDRDSDGTARIVYAAGKKAAKGALESVRARAVVGADGARSAVARQALPGAERVPCVFAYHEIVKSPPANDTAVPAVATGTDGAATGNGNVFDAKRCDVYYQGKFSPDFYAWIFPHGEQTSIGTGSAHKGFSLRQSVTGLREATGLDTVETVRREGAPIPLKPLKKWDNGRDVILAGDAAGVVAPASGEGIYYAMLGGRMAADAVQAFLVTGDSRELAKARKKYMKLHGQVFWILGIMQHFWYKNDKRRERFVSICKDKDVQKLTWDAYMHKELQKRDPMAHVRIFFKDLAHLFRLVSPSS